MLVAGCTRWLQIVFVLKAAFYSYSNMTIDFDSSLVLSKKEREERLLDLHFNQNKNYRQIAKEMKISLRDIGEIVNRAKEEKERQEHKSLFVQAYELFSKGNTTLKVAIKLNLGQAQVAQYHMEYLKLRELDCITKLYLEFKNDTSYFVNLCKAAKAAKMDVSQVVNLLKMANNDIRSIERKCQDLKREEASLNSRNLNSARAVQQLSNDISEKHEILNQYRSSCKEERSELAKLRLQKEKLESVVRQFHGNNEILQRIKELVKQIVEQRLMNHRHVLLLALQSIIDSCRKDPVKFNILYYNLSTAAITTTETRLADFGMIDQYNYGLATNDQLCYQQENANDDIAYSKIIVNVAEQFFNRMIKELEHVCINQIIEAFISGSISPQLTKKSFLDSKPVLPVLPIQTNGNKKEDSLRKADIVTR
jgi:hypothetical protein